MRAGLLGEKLGHSFSPRIHSFFGNYSYELFEAAKDELDSFMKSGRFDALNVTIPYKKAVIPYCAEQTDAARAIGSVNTIVRRADGTLLGDNTDAAGFASMIKKLDIDPRGKKALVLGSGGASLTAVYVLKEMGADPVVVISRSGENNYENLARHRDAKLLVNATPVGMYPDNGAMPVDPASLPQLEGVLDLIYNPAATQLLLEAQKLGIPCINGLYMLVEQARKAAERFTGQLIDPALSDKVHAILRRETENIVLIGMPGCGKSSIGRMIAEKTGRPFIDADDQFQARIGMTIPEYFASHTQEEFRREETRILRDICKKSGIVIASGGGCVTRAENRDLIRQNARVFFIRREIADLPTEGRPLSQANQLEEMYRSRLPLYLDFADTSVDNTGLCQTAETILEVFNEDPCN